MSSQRTVWRISRAGSLARLARFTEDLPDPGPGEARLRVEAIGLNFADILACLGLYSATPGGAFVPGLECAGTVEAIGPPAEQGPPCPPVAVGDRLCVLTRFGAYADALNFDLRYSVMFPADWTVAEAAAWPVQGLTAWYGLIDRARTAPGECVLVQSAAGGVGLQALAVLQRAGAKTIAAVGHAGKQRFLVEQAGHDPAAVIVRDERRFGAQIDAALAAVGCGRLDVVFDAVLGPWFRPAFDRLGPEGRYVLFGAADFMPSGARPNYPALLWRYLRRPRLDPLAMISDNRAFIGFNLIWLWEQVDRMPAALQALRAMTSRPPHVGARLPFGRAREAMELLQAGGTIGKVVLEL